MEKKEKMITNNNGKNYEFSLREVAGNLDSVKELLSARIDDLQTLIDERDRLYRERVEYSEKSTLKSDLATDKRFESVNEFRATLSDQAQSFITRTEYAIQHKSAEEKIDSIKEQLPSFVKINEHAVIHKSMEDKIDLAVKTLTDKIDLNNKNQIETIADLKNAQSTSKGIKEGVSNTVYYLMAFISLACAIVGMLVGAGIVSKFNQQAPQPIVYQIPSQPANQGK